MYAEVGQISHQHRQNLPPSFLNLDDTPIEYVQINHKLQTDTNNRVKKALPLEPIGMCIHACAIKRCGLLMRLQLAMHNNYCLLIYCATLDDSLSVNLDNLLIQLRSQLTDKWYQFGEKAGIHKDVLDNFAKQCSPNDCIMEMLDYWLRNSKQAPTWKDVAKILKEINLKDLGQDIDEVYKTGK